MKRIIFSLLAACASMCAQTPSCQSVQDVLYSVAPAAPGPMNGTITISLGYTNTNSGPTVQQSVARLTVTSGAISTCLVPGNYTVTYSVKRAAPLTGSVEFVRKWSIASSGGPFTVKQIESTGQTWLGLSGKTWNQL